MMTARILVVEDEADLCSGLCDLLSLEGYQVSGVGSIAAYDAWVRDHGYDILLLDRTLPDGEGLDVLRTHRLSNDTPVIIMSGKGAPEDRIAGLEADADYYLVKPVESAELIALVRRFARRLVVPEAEVYRLDAQRWKLHMPDEGVVPLTRNEIIRALGGRPDVYDERRLEVLVRRFRKKITEAGYDNFPLSTVYGSGYAFNERLEML